MSEPDGFRTSYHPEDWEGGIKWAPPALQPRSNPRALSGTGTVGRARTRYGYGHVYIVNDNEGHGFRFAPHRSGWHGWVNLDLLEDQERRKDLGLPSPESIRRDLAEHVALGAIMQTDTLYMSLEALPPSVDLEPVVDRIDRRGAWSSFAFLLGQAAAQELDVETSEFLTGVHVARDSEGGSLKGHVFFADRLENGAGYATHLGKAPIFERVMSRARRYVNRFLEVPHADECDSACYDCLQEYLNQRHHPILDWRLASDLLQLAEGGDLDLDHARRDGEKLVKGFVDDFAGEFHLLTGGVPAIAVAGAALLVLHPLEARPHTNENLVAALVDAEDLVGDPDLVRTATTFDLRRRPAWVYREAQQA